MPAAGAGLELGDPAPEDICFTDRKIFIKIYMTLKMNLLIIQAPGMNMMNIPFIITRDANQRARSLAPQELF